MADISVSMGVTGKDVVQGAFKDVAASAEAMGQALAEHTKQLVTAFLGYESLVKVIGTFKAALEVGDKLADLSDQTGISAGKLAILQRAFENSGLQADELGKYVNKMQKFIESAGDTSSAAAEKLARIGLTAEDLKKLAPDEQFATIAKAIAGISDPGEKAAESMEIFGKAGGKTLALFNDFDQTMAEAQMQVGGLADIMDAKAGTFNKVNDALGAIGKKTTEFAVGLLDDALPALDTLTTALKNIDATAFGRQFSDALVKGIDFALGIFRDPGDAFLAFGDALVVALKSGLNVLRDGLQYVFDWATNYVTEIIPSYAGILKSEFNVAVGAVVGFFGGQLAQVFSDLAVLIPGKLGDAMGQAAEKLATYSKEATDLAQQGLADAWEKVGNAAAKATEETHLQSQDWMDVASSAQQMRDHAEAVRSKGEAFRHEIETANLLMAGNAAYVDKMVGGAKDIKQFMQEAYDTGKGVFGKTPGADVFRDTTANQGVEDMQRVLGIKNTTNPIPTPNPTGGNGGTLPPPIYNPADLSGGGLFNVKGLDSGMQQDLTAAGMEIKARVLDTYGKQLADAQKNQDFQGAAYYQRQMIDQQNAMARQALGDAAARETARQYTRTSENPFGDERTSSADIIRQIASDLRSQGMTPQDANKAAEQQYQSSVQQNMGPAIPQSAQSSFQQLAQQTTGDQRSSVSDVMRDLVSKFRGEGLNPEAANKAAQQEMNAATQQSQTPGLQSAFQKVADQYTGDKNASVSEVLNQIFQKYRGQGLSAEDANKAAQQEYQDAINKNKGPYPDKGGAGGSPSLPPVVKSPQEKANDVLDKILSYLKDTVRLDQKLPLMALS